MVLTGRATNVLQWWQQWECRKAKPILKSRLSSDCPLQLEGMKLESLVIADQNAAVNTFPGLVS